MNEVSILQAAGPAASAAIRSLNADFVRKGIVVSSTSDAQQALDPKILRLVESLKGVCKKAGTREIGEITTAIQLWKERSLHHTLQTLDQTKKDPPVDGIKTGSERQIQAIELHEKAGREVKETVLRVLQNIIDSILKQIEGFTEELAVVVRELVKPEVEEELAHERAVTERMIADKQRFMKEHLALQKAHSELTKRLDEWETEEHGGGDALLCGKLREQVHQLKAARAEMATKMSEMERQNEQWRYEMVTMKTELEIAHKTLAMTLAMHEKETKQLVDLVHTKEDHFERVRQATAVAKTVSSPQIVRAGNGVSMTAPTITSYDSLSGRNIRYSSPPEQRLPSSPSKTTRTVLVGILPSQPRQQTHAELPPTSPSPNKKRLVSPKRPVVAANCQEEDTLPVQIPTEQISPRGRVQRQF